MVWAIAAGLVIGAALGAFIGKLVIRLRTRHQHSVGLDEFLALAERIDDQLGWVAVAPTHNEIVRLQ